MDKFEKTELFSYPKVHSESNNQSDWHLKNDHELSNNLSESEPTMNICGKCGKQYPGNMMFCPFCKVDHQEPILEEPSFGCVYASPKFNEPDIPFIPFYPKEKKENIFFKLFKRNKPR